LLELDWAGFITKFHIFFSKRIGTVLIVLKMGDYPADMGPLIERRLTEADLPGEFYVERSEVFGSRVEFESLEKETAVWTTGWGEPKKLLNGDSPCIAMSLGMGKMPGDEPMELFDEYHGWKNEFMERASVYNRYEDFSHHYIMRLFAVKEKPPPEGAE
jgi:hypothetical protein